MATSAKKRAWVRDDPQGYLTASQAYDSITDNCKKVGEIKIKHVFNPNRGEETRFEISVIKIKDGKFYTASFSMNIRRYQAEMLALKIAPWLNKKISEAA